MVAEIAPAARQLSAISYQLSAVTFDIGAIITAGTAFSVQPLPVGESSSRARRELTTDS
jgi:hypothetical protein